MKIEGFTKHLIRNGPSTGCARWVSNDERYTLHDAMILKGSRWCWILQDHRTNVEIKFLDVEDALKHVKLMKETRTQ